ncbi:TPA: hypothetical protein ACPSJ9_002970, partial [Legionella anisa]
ILNHFIYDNSETKLFGFQQKPLKAYHNDKLVERNVLNIWFDRDEHGKSYLIISGNLRSEFRNVIGFNLLKLLDSRSLQ